MRSHSRLVIFCLQISLSAVRAEEPTGQPANQEEAIHKGLGFVETKSLAWRLFKFKKMAVTRDSLRLALEFVLRFLHRPELQWSRQLRGSQREHNGQEDQNRWPVPPR